MPPWRLLTHGAGSPARNMAVFGRVDHAANATAAGMALRPTELVIFGNPKGGTLLMQDRQRAGIDLPLKALVWQDATNVTWISYNDPAWVAKRHGLGHEVEAPVKAMTAMLNAVTRAAAAA